MTLGNAIKLIRTAKGIKQQDLASRLGKSANYLSLIEGDKREPSMSFLKHLGRELGVPVAMFFLWQDPEYTNLQNADLREFRDLMARLEAMYVTESRREEDERSRRNQRNLF
ncbi:MAG: helix-turn-helix domain-containing protein [Terriglobales bacterium]